MFARHLRTFCVLRNKCENQYDVILIIKTNAVCFSPVRPHPHPPNLRPYILIASIGQSLPPWVLLCKESPSCDPSRQFLWSYCTEGQSAGWCVCHLATSSVQGAQAAESQASALQLHLSKAPSASVLQGHLLPWQGS